MWQLALAFLGGRWREYYAMFKTGRTSKKMGRIDEDDEDVENEQNWVQNNGKKKTENLGNFVFKF
jgi:hypothetical protein